MYIALHGLLSMNRVQQDRTHGHAHAHGFTATMLCEGAMVHHVCCDSVGFKYMGVHGKNTHAGTSQPLHVCSNADRRIER